MMTAAFRPYVLRSFHPIGPLFLLRAVLAFVALSAAPLTPAQDSRAERATPVTSGDPSSQSSAERSLRSFIEDQTKHVAAQTQPAGGARVEVVVGSLDPRLKLAPCAEVEPYLPNGTRLWGKTHIGLRCRAGANWSVFLPVEVRVFGPALVATAPLTAGQPFGPGDYRMQEVELSREAPGWLSDPGEIESKAATRAIAPGTVLRGELLRQKAVIAPGDMVRVVFAGSGFSVASDGRALAPASLGQSVRVQMESGRVVSGRARDGRHVELQ